MDNGVDQRKRLQHVSMDERGITMLHFALVLPLLFLLVVAILDLCYFLTVESVLDAAVHRALTRALSVPNLDVSPIGADPDSHRFRRLVMAREKSTGEGIAFLRETGLIRTDGPAPGQARGTRLLTVTYTEDRTAGRPVTFEAGVMVLLPGECAWIAELERTECNRETLGTISEAPPPMQPPAFLMESHPVEVFAAARVDSYLPFGIAPDLVTVRAYGYRQPILQGPFPAFEDPQLLAEGPPTAGPTSGPPGLTSPEMPEDPEFGCAVDWGKCLGDAQLVGDARSPKNIADSDGTCVCAPI